MNDKYIRSFWFGFAVALTGLACLYWLWKRKREVLTEPLVLFADGESERMTEVEPTEPDSLETIRGIGPVSANRLNEAGIYTFAQLADTMPDRLQEITGVTRWDPADWIAEAKNLAQD